MDVKQEPIDPHDGVIKTEPDLVAGQIEQKFLIPSEQQTFENCNNHGLALADNVDDFEAAQLVNVKQEIIEYEMPKIEQSNLPTKVDHDSFCENVMKNVSAAIKEEIFNDEVKAVKATDMFVNIADIKQEFNEYVQSKVESEHLTTYCDLPTLKSEHFVFADYAQPCSSKQPERILKRSNKIAKCAFKQKRKVYPCLVCQKSKCI